VIKKKSFSIVVFIVFMYNHVSVGIYVCLCMQLSGLDALNEVSTWLNDIGHSLLTSHQLFTDEAAVFVSYTLSVAVSQQHCQAPYLSQLLHTLNSLSDKYTSVSCITALCYTVSSDAHSWSKSCCVTDSTTTNNTTTTTSYLLIKLVYDSFLKVKS